MRHRVQSDQGCPSQETAPRKSGVPPSLKLRRAGKPPHSKSRPLETTMVYTHVVRDFRRPAMSPLDLLGGEKAG